MSRPEPSMPTDLPRLPARPRDSHKGTYGTVIVVGGSCGRATGLVGSATMPVARPAIAGGSPQASASEQAEACGTVMLGAPALSGLAALRAGCGLCKLAMPAPLLPHALQVCPSATGLAIPTDDGGAVEPSEVCAVIDRCADNATCLAVGPGLGTSAGAQAAVLRAVQQDHTPVVLDADGINALSLIPEFRRDFRAAAVLTPHPGEFRRLVSALGLPGDLGLDKNREAAAQQLAQRLGAIIVLKGAGTVVTDGQRVWTNTVDHPCLATAGTGDVLTGIIASLIAQFVPTPQQMLFKAKVPQMPTPAGRPLDLYDAARVGVAVHGMCGVMWASRQGASGGLIASDLTELIPAVVESIRS